MRILYFDLDSCRSDHLGCYGYTRPTSPVIDELASRSVVFRNCYASDTPCLPSRAALFSGRFGMNNGVTCHEGPASQMCYAGHGHEYDADRLMWMMALHQAGWQTISFSSFAKRHIAWWFTAGFTQFYGSQLPGGLETADEVNALVLPWLEANGAHDHWFMHVNYWDMHTPYFAPRQYVERMHGKPTYDFPNAASIASDVRNVYGPRTARDWWSGETWRNPSPDMARRIANMHPSDFPPGLTKERLQTLYASMPNDNPDTFEHFLGFLDGYDAGIAYADEKIGEILATLDRLGVLEDTAIIISSDHGESFGELGMYFEHGNCSEGTTHVPLIIHWPGVTDTGGSFDGLMYQLDLPPTVLSLLGVKVPSGWDGMSMARIVQHPEADVEGRSHLILGTGIYSYQRAVRNARYRLVRTIHSGLYPYDPLYLFDLETDPHQTRNIASEYPDIVARLDHYLVDWTYQYTTGPTGVQDPFQVQIDHGVSPDLYCSRDVMEKRLVDLKREDQLADLRQRRDKKRALRL